MKFKTIYNMKLAGYLMLDGFILMDIAENNNGTGKKVFFFKQSDKLERRIEEYFKNKQ